MSKLVWTDRNGYLANIKDEKKFLVALDMGLGKTSLLLSLIDYKMFKTKEVKKVLIIAPKKVSLTTWQNEAKKFSNLNHLTNIITLIDGDKEQRINKFKANLEHEIHIISSSLTEWLTGERVASGSRTKFVKNEHTPDYDLIIVDECSQFKSTRSNRFKALKKLALGKQLFMLSGTPFSNLKKQQTNEGKVYYEKADELYYVFNLLGLYNDTVTSFRENFCYTVHKYDFDYKMNENVYNGLLEKLGKHSIRDESNLNVKMKHVIIRTKNDLKALSQITEEYVLDVGKNEIEVDSAVGLINKALQIGSGFIYDGDKTYFLHRHKLDVIKRFIETTDKSVCIAYNFKEDKKRLMEEFDCHEYSEENEKLWNDGKIRILLLNPFSDKFGLNIQYGGNTIIWYSLVWSAESYEQLNYRLYRQGQNKDVIVYYLIAEGGYDQHVFDTLVKKIDTKDELLQIIEDNSKF